MADRFYKTKSANEEIRIMENYLGNHPDLNSFVVWADSFVSQYRKSVMRTAIKKVLQDHNLESVQINIAH